ncbi:DapA-like [Fusarium oxysporum f. sp. vasinfectum]|nr:DapA-like [Fusarium oxysporum f. sp. vasinfectum]
MERSTIQAKAKPLPPGVYTPVVTLYKADDPTQQVDHEAMHTQCQALIKAGMHGLVYLGTNGELVLLSREERKAIIKTAVQAASAAGGPDYPIVAGISAQSTQESIQNAKDAAEAGAGFGLLLPPNYWPKALPSQAIVSYFKEVAAASPIPIVIYNFPRSVKLTCGNVGKLARLTALFSHEQFGVYGGSSDYLLPTLHSGGSGCVTGMGNIFPSSTAGVYDLWKAGKIDEANKLQGLVAHAEWACKKGISNTKYGAWHFLGKDIGLDNETSWHMRKPYQPLDDKSKEWTVKTLRVLADTEKQLRKQ